MVQHVCTLVLDRDAGQALSAFQLSGPSRSLQLSEAFYDVQEEVLTRSLLRR